MILYIKVFFFLTCLSIINSEAATYESRVRLCDQSLSLDANAISYENKDGLNILMMASEIGCISLVRSLVEIIDVNKESKQSGVTALFSAIESGKSEIVTVLINNGVNVNAKDSFLGTTALRIAVERNNIELTKLLLTAGANPNNQDSLLLLTPLYMAVVAKKVKIIKLLMKYGADPQVKNSKGVSILDIAKQRGYKKIVKLFE